jgi:hypothetical protein
MKEEIKSFIKTETSEVQYFVCPVCDKEYQSINSAQWCVEAHEKEAKQNACEHEWRYNYYHYEDPPEIERTCKGCLKKETRHIGFFPDEALPLIFNMLTE